MPKLWARGLSDAHTYACMQLSAAGFTILKTPLEEMEGVLLDVPSFRSLDFPPEAVWEKLPKNTAVIGGGLTGLVPEQFRTIDLLQDLEYTARNADITARCALRLATEHLEETLCGLPVLILGWGRIGKCLSRLLRNLDAQVCVFARKPGDRAMLQGLGYAAVSEAALNDALPQFRLVYNTVPAPILSREMTEKCRDCLMIDLASQLGIQSENVLWARGLPGKMVPESSGKLIAETVLRLWEA